MKRLILLGLLAAPLLSTLSAATQQSQGDGSIPVLAVDALQLAYFTPKQLKADQLAPLAGRMLGRNFYIAEKGGRQAAPVVNIQLLGDSLVIYDEAMSVARILKSLENLDKAPTTTPEQSPTIRMEFRPRYISLDAVEDLLRTFDRQIVEGEDSFETVSFLKEEGMAVLRDTPDRVEKMVALLKQHDLPPTEVRFRCHLLMPGDGGGVPAELDKELKSLMPDLVFEQVGVAFLRASVDSTAPVVMKVGEHSDYSYYFSFRPTAFDSEGGVLSVSRCKLTRNYRGDNTEDLFSTTLTLKVGEPTVLGASGRTPVFVAVEVER